MGRSTRRHKGRQRPYDLSPTGIVCPRCRRGEIEPVRRSYGLVYACTERPICAFWMSARPTGRTCSRPRAGRGPCGALLMEGTARIPERCSDQTCPNHRPVAS